jgi:hypothetical protein
MTVARTVTVVGDLDAGAPASISWLVLDRGAAARKQKTRDK